MALASCAQARSVVELSLSPLYHYQFSSIAKSIAALDDGLEETIRRMCLPYAEKARPFYLLQTDTTSLCKPHSPTLSERTYIHTADNTVAGNRPLSVGYEVSFVNLSPDLSSWTLPLSIRRVGPDQSASDQALDQLSDLMPCFAEELVVNALDSKYGNAAYLARAHRHTHMVSIVRLRAGMKVYPMAEPRSTGGARQVYGPCYYLLMHSRHKTYTHPRTKAPIECYQEALLEQPPDEELTLEARTQKGRALTVHLWRYNDRLIRTKDGYNMKDKPFDIVVAQVCDTASGRPIFAHPLFVAASGERKDELATEDIYLLYRKRYAIEPYFRLAKQRLLLERYQSPDRSHIENWLLVVQLVSWLLYAARDEVRFQARKWETSGRRTYDEETMARVRRGAQSLFLTFEPSLFKPSRCKKGKGRPRGYTFKPRERHRVCQKTTKKATQARKYRNKR